MVDLKNMSGDEFVAKLLAGERDFRKIKLEHGYRLSIPAVSPTQKYYYDVTGGNSDQIKEYSLDVSGSDLSGLKVTSLFWPYITAVETDFKFATLNAAQFYFGDLRKANFFGANMERTTFFRADVTGANFSRAKLDYTTFEYADLAEVNFTEADLRGADLRGKNLDTAKGLDSAHFFKTHINPEDKHMLAKMLKERKFMV